MQTKLRPNHGRPAHTIGWQMKYQRGSTEGGLNGEADKKHGISWHDSHRPIGARENPKSPIKKMEGRQETQCLMHMESILASKQFWCVSKIGKHG